MDTLTGKNINYLIHYGLQMASRSPKNFTTVEKFIHKSICSLFICMGRTGMDQKSYLFL